MAKLTGRKNRPPEIGQLFLQGGIIVVAVLVIFWPVLHGDWLWDDDWYLTKNPLMHDPWRLWKAWFEPGSFVEYYPIQQTVQWVQWQLWGDDTFGYHLTNVILHMANALLIWWLFHKLGIRLAWLGGLLFAVHPVVVESVAWIAELKNSLSLTPFLLSLGFFVDYQERGERRDYLLTLGFFLAAMLCKISMAPFPVMMLIYAWWKRGRIGWNDVKESVPFFVIALVLSVLTLLSGDWYRLRTLAPNDDVVIGGFLSRLALSGLAISFWFSKCLLPAGLLIVYPKWPVNPPSLIQFLPWPVMAGLAAWFWKKRSGWGRHALLGCGFFLIMLAPFMGFIPASYMRFTWVMDHFLYIPIIGLLGLFVLALGKAEDRIPVSFRPAGIALAAVVVGLLIWTSRLHAATFVDQETLWTYTLARNPDAFPAHQNLGDVLLMKGQLDDAEKEYREALRIDPDDARTHSNLAVVLFRKGASAEGLDHLKRAVALGSQDAEIHGNLAVILAQSGQIAEALEEYGKSLKIDPNNPKTHANMGLTLSNAGRIPEAIEQYKLSLKLDPDNPKIQSWLQELENPPPAAPAPVPATK